ncbi:hypothetical protein [Paracoccus tibetensis]|uniref:Uncharacterized protein n=1 Tax=Paracoccus tibetensis TaxID=336292 RepID=A0A1G5JNK7_9RHOB|nr:hypothetical protein [Paracoccus tibetensis]SCY89907.1 hypothetical protein SAMN05660710_03330 [Paracoccus tibetensis]
MMKITALALLLATPLAAHEPGIGPNGGMQVDAGPYRVEVTTAGTLVNVFVTMDDESELDTSTLSGTAMLLVDGKPLRATLAPSEPGVLSADTDTELPQEVSGAVQITGADGVSAQAKF